MFIHLSNKKTNGGFLKWWYPKWMVYNGLKWVIWGYHHLRKSPNDSATFWNTSTSETIKPSSKDDFWLHEPQGVFFGCEISVENWRFQWFPTKALQNGHMFVNLIVWHLPTINLEVQGQQQISRFFFICSAKIGMAFKYFHKFFVVPKCMAQP